MARQNQTISNLQDEIYLQCRTEVKSKQSVQMLQQQKKAFGPFSQKMFPKDVAMVLVEVKIAGF